VRVAVRFDQGEVEDIRVRLSQWLESASVGEMEGDEMLSGLADIAEELDVVIQHLRRALGW
jgi:hypothetical protein